MSAKVRQSRLLLLLFLIVLWRLPLVSQPSVPTSVADRVMPHKAPDTVSLGAPVFDVVSIRPVKDSGNFSWQIDVDQFTARENPLGFIIVAAYYPPVYQKMAYESRKILLGAPDWVWKAPYDFRGKVAPSDMAEWKRQREHFDRMTPMPMMQSMLQAALADRCKLAVHRTPGEIDGYALVIDKHGPNRKNLKDAIPGEEIPSSAQHLRGEAWMIPIMPGGKVALTFFQTPMATLAAELASLVGTPIEDRTGLQGRFDFDVARWQTDFGYEWDVGALGLKLERTEIPSELLVIDHIERPSPN